MHDIVDSVLTKYSVCIYTVTFDIILYERIRFKFELFDKFEKRKKIEI